MNFETAGTKKTPWHALEIDKVFQQISSSPEGLSQVEAEKRLSQYGQNILSPPRKRSPLIRFIVQFHNVLIYVLLAAD